MAAASLVPIRSSSTWPRVPVRRRSRAPVCAQDYGRGCGGCGIPSAAVPRQSAAEWASSSALRVLLSLRADGEWLAELLIDLEGKTNAFMRVVGQPPAGCLRSSGPPCPTAAVHVDHAE